MEPLPPLDDWDEAVAAWRRVFTALSVEPQQRSVLVCEPMYSPKAHREALARLLLDSLGVAAMHFAAQPLLALYASGRTTGVVVDLGETQACVVPVFEGWIMPQGVRRFGITCDRLTAWTAELAARGDEAVPAASERAVWRAAKERLACVAAQAGEEPLAASSEGAAHTLPDGTTFASFDGAGVGEALFAPAVAGLGAWEGLHACVFAAVMACDVDIRQDLASNVVPAGGGACVRGLHARLQRELAATFRANGLPWALRVREPASVSNAAWVGGSILGSTHESVVWMDGDDFARDGPAGVHRKFPVDIAAPVDPLTCESK